MNSMFHEKRQINQIISRTHTQKVKVRCTFALPKCSSCIQIIDMSFLDAHNMWIMIFHDSVEKKGQQNYWQTFHSLRSLQLQPPQKKEHTVNQMHAQSTRYLTTPMNFRTCNLDKSSCIKKQLWSHNLEKLLTNWCSKPTTKHTEHKTTINLQIINTKHDQWTGSSKTSWPRWYQYMPWILA